HRADRRNVDELLRVAVATCWSDVGLGKAPPVDVGHAGLLRPGLAGQADDPLHEDPAKALATCRLRRLKDNDVASPRGMEAIDEPIGENAVRAARLTVGLGPGAAESLVPSRETGFDTD